MRPVFASQREKCAPEDFAHWELRPVTRTAQLHRAVIARQFDNGRLFHCALCVYVCLWSDHVLAVCVHVCMCDYHSAIAFSV